MPGLGDGGHPIFPGGHHNGSGHSGSSGGSGGGGGGGSAVHGAPGAIETQQTGHNTHIPAWVIRRQKLLKAAGYNVAVDGKWGPQSQRAWAAFSARVSPAGLRGAMHHFGAKPALPPGYVYKHGQVVTRAQAHTATLIERAQAHAQAIASGPEKVRDSRLALNHKLERRIATDLAHQQANLGLKNILTKTPGLGIHDPRQEGVRKAREALAGGKPVDEIRHRLQHDSYVKALSEAKRREDERVQRQLESILGPNFDRIKADPHYLEHAARAGQLDAHQLAILMREGFLTASDREDVRVVQEVINHHGGHVAVDGEYGTTTDAALKGLWARAARQEFNQQVAETKARYYQVGDIAQLASVRAFGHVVSPAEFVRLLQSGSSDGQKLARQLAIADYQHASMEALERYKVELAREMVANGGGVLSVVTGDVHTETVGAGRFGQFSRQIEEDISKKYSAANLDPRTVAAILGTTDIGRIALTSRDLAEFTEREHVYAAERAHLAQGGSRGWFAGALNHVPGGGFIVDAADRVAGPTMLALDGISWAGHQIAHLRHFTVAPGLAGLNPTQSGRPTTIDEAWRQSWVTYNDLPLYQRVLMEAMFDPVNLVTGEALGRIAGVAARGYAKGAIRAIDSFGVDLAPRLPEALDLRITRRLMFTRDSFESLHDAGWRRFIGEGAAHSSFLHRTGLYTLATTTRSAAITKVTHALRERAIFDLRYQSVERGTADATEGLGAETQDAVRELAARHAESRSLVDADILRDVGQSVSEHRQALRQVAPSLVNWVTSVPTSLFAHFGRDQGLLSQTGRVIEATFLESASTQFLERYGMMTALAEKGVTGAVRRSAKQSVDVEHLRPRFVVPDSVAETDVSALNLDELRALYLEHFTEDELALLRTQSGSWYAGGIPVDYWDAYVSDLNLFRDRLYNQILPALDDLLRQGQRERSLWDAADNLIEDSSAIDAHIENLLGYSPRDAYDPANFVSVPNPHAGETFTRNEAEHFQRQEIERRRGAAQSFAEMKTRQEPRRAEHWADWLDTREGEIEREVRGAWEQVSARKWRDTRAFVDVPVPLARFIDPASHATLVGRTPRAEGVHFDNVAIGKGFHYRHVATDEAGNAVYRVARNDNRGGIFVQIEDSGAASFEVGLDPALHGKGVGRDLYAEALNVARAKGATRAAPRADASDEALHVWESLHERPPRGWKPAEDGSLGLERSGLVTDDVIEGASTFVKTKHGRVHIRVKHGERGFKTAEISQFSWRQNSGPAAVDQLVRGALKWAIANGVRRLRLPTDLRDPVVKQAFDHIVENPPPGWRVNQGSPIKVAPKNGGKVTYRPGTAFLEPSHAFTGDEMVELRQLAETVTNISRMPTGTSRFTGRDLRPTREGVRSYLDSVAADPAKVDDWRKFAESTARLEAVQKLASSQLLPELYKEQHLLWYYLREHQSRLYRSVYHVGVTGINAWKLSVLPFRVAFTIRNLADNTIKSILMGLHDPRLFFNPDGGSLFEFLPVRAISGLFGFLDKMFGLHGTRFSVRRVFDLLIDHLWSQHPEVIGKMIGAHGIPFPAELMDSGTIATLAESRSIVLEDEVAGGARQRVSSIGGGDVKRIIQKTDDPRLPLIRRFTDSAWDLMARNPEVYSRKLLYVTAYRREFEESNDEWAAMKAGLDAADTALFDYDQVSVLEDNLKVFFPFIFFWRKNAGFWTSQVFDKPWFFYEADKAYQAHLDSNDDLPSWMRRYIDLAPVGGLLDHIPGAGWLADYLQSGQYADPMSYVSIVAFYRAFKEGNPNLAPDRQGVVFLSQLSDGFNSIGLGMNPFLRAGGERLGLLNRWAWRDIFPQTSLITSLTSADWFQEHLGTGPSGFNIEDALLDPIFKQITSEPSGAELRRDRFDFYVQQEMAAQAALGEKPNRAKAEKKIRTYIALQAVVGFSLGVYPRHIGEGDLAIYKIGDTMYKTMTDGDLSDAEKREKTRAIWLGLSPSEQEGYRLFKKRGYQPEAFDRYRLALEGAQAYYQIDDWDEKQHFLDQHPDVQQVVNPVLDGDMPSERYLKLLELSTRTDVVMTLTSKYLDDIDADPAATKAATDYLITAELRKFWAANDTPADRRERHIRAAYHHYISRTMQTYTSLPASDKQAFLDQHPELERWWAKDNTMTDDYRSIMSASNATFREVYFHFLERDDWDSADAFLKAHPFIFDFTSAEGRIDPQFGKWFPKSEAQADYAKVADQLRIYVSYDDAGLAADYLTAHPLVAWYLNKYGAAGGLLEQHNDFQRIAAQLQAYYHTGNDQREAFLNANPELRSYFAKYAQQTILSQHARDYLAIKSVLDHFFDLPESERSAYLAQHPELTAYFEKYGHHSGAAGGGGSQYGRSDHGAFASNLRESLALNPDISRRYHFWQQFWALRPDQRLRFIHTHAADAGIFIYGSLGYDARQRAEERWHRKAMGLGMTDHAADYIRVAPLLKLYFKLDGADKNLFLEMNPELQDYLRKWSKPDNLVGRPDVTHQLRAYYDLPPYSTERREYLASHPDLQDYFNEDASPRERALQAQIEAYFGLPFERRDQYLATHPEVRAFFDARTREKDLFGNLSAAFNLEDPRMAKYRAMYADIPILDAIKRDILLRSRVHEPVEQTGPDERSQLEQRRARRPAA